jgi:hypothetical protein
MIRNIRKVEDESFYFDVDNGNQQDETLSGNSHDEIL